jgi:hypothetical protein
VAAAKCFSRSSDLRSSSKHFSEESIGPVQNELSVNLLNSGQFGPHSARPCCPNTVPTHRRFPTKNRSQPRNYTSSRKMKGLWWVSPSLVHLTQMTPWPDWQTRPWLVHPGFPAGRGLLEDSKLLASPPRPHVDGCLYFTRHEPRSRAGTSVFRQLRPASQSLLLVT